jgi:hypothetical protein
MNAAKRRAGQSDRLDSQSPRTNVRPGGRAAWFQIDRL